MKSASRSFLPRLALLGAMLLTGCYPVEKLWWSPRGDVAAVLAGEELRLMDAQGKLGAVLLEKAHLEKVPSLSVSWLPDGSGLVVERARVLASWQEVRGIIPQAEVEHIESALPALRAILKMSAHAKELNEVLTDLPEAKLDRMMLALRAECQKDPASVEKWTLALPEGEKTLVWLKAPGFTVHELCLLRLRDGSVAEAQVLRSSLLRPALLPRVSPRHPVLALTRLDDEGEHAALDVMSLDGKTSVELAKNTSGAYQWMPDGRSLVFMAPVSGESSPLQVLHRVTVVDDAGRLIEKPDSGRSLAMAAAHDRPHLQVLPDGRVLFASQAVTLPALGRDVEAPQLDLYLLAADGSTVKRVPTVPGELPSDLGSFIAAPDGSRVAVVESRTDAVAVVDIESGKMQLISPPHPRWECRTVPAWRSATELAFATLREGRPACMMWHTDGTQHPFSTDWPAAATADWLSERKSETTTPPTR